MSEKIGRLVEQVLLAAQSKCERCRTRRIYHDKKWCKRCQQWWERHNHKADVGYHLQNLLGLRYWQAKIYHLAPNLKKMFQTLSDDQGVMLWGDVGCGKTYAMSALARRFYVQGWDVKFVRWYELILEIRAASIKCGDELRQIEPYVSVDKLFIDDIGVMVGRDSQESAFSLRTLELILDKRLADYRPTFITSNKSIEDLGNTFDARVASRIQESCIILQTKGRDKRIEGLK